VFKLATLFVDVVANQSGFDKSLAAMGGMLGGLVVATNRMTDQGSNLIETMNKVDVAFGNSAGTVTGFANEMADKFGSVKNVTLDAAAGMGLILQAAGMTKSESAGLSIQLVRLADDMKSLYHIPLEDALHKIEAGLVGQARPLREYGVLLSAAAVNADLVAHGATKVHGQFTEQEKVMARLRIITDGLKVAQGDHAKTMDQYANQIDMVKGKMENYTTSIGAGMAASKANLMVTVVEKGMWAGWTEHWDDVGRQLFGDKNTHFQKGADIAAGVQHGLTAEMFKFKPPPLFREYGTESVIDELQQEKNALDESMEKSKYGYDATRFFGEISGYDMMKPEERSMEDKREKAEAKAENEFLKSFLGFDLPEAKHKRSKMSKEHEEYLEHPGGDIDKKFKEKAESMGVAEFAAKLRMEQKGGGVPEKQLTELQQIRKAEMEQAKNMAKLLERGFPAVLG